MAKGISLHIGVNRVDPAHYAGWDGKLNGCEADARAMDAIARREGFEPKVLLTAAAVRSNVVTSLRTAAARLGRGDFFFLTYSGHGGQVPDANGDEEDFNDETWCLYDGQLVDDELHALYTEFAPGVRILILSDSCHSGSVSKSDTYNPSRPREAGIPDGWLPKVMPTDVAFQTYERNQEFYRSLAHRIPPEGAKSVKDMPLRASVRLISGCQDQQLSFDGPFNGAFTAALLQVWGEGAFAGNYDAFHAAIVGRLTRQLPNHKKDGPIDPVYEAQRPFRLAYP